MPFSSLSARALATLALGASTAHAASLPAQDAADPQAAVPATIYQPAIGYRAPAPSAGTPDANWRASNAAVGRTSSMSMPMSMGPMAHDHPAQEGRGSGAGPRQCKPAGQGAGCACCEDMQGMPHADAGQCQAGAGCEGCACCAGKQCMAPRPATAPMQSPASMQHMHGAGHRHGDAP